MTEKSSHSATSSDLDELRRLHHEVAGAHQHLSQVSHDLNELTRRMTGQPISSTPSARPPVPGAPGSARPTGGPPLVPPPGPYPPPGAPGHPSWTAVPRPGVAGPTHPGRPPVTQPGFWDAKPQQPAPAPSAVVGWWQSESAVTRTLSVAGALVTLAGLTMLLILAIQENWFGPEARVAAAGVLGVVLIVLGFVVRRREMRAGRTGLGALGLVSTGFAALYLVVVSVSTIYHWVPGTVGLIVGAAVAGAGLWVARQWDSQLVGAVIVVGAAIMGPTVAQDIAWAAPFAVALVIVTWLAQWGRGWSRIVLLAAVPATGMVMGFLGETTTYAEWETPADPRRPAALAVTIVFLVVTWVFAALDARRHLTQSRAAAPLVVLGVIPLFQWTGAMADPSAAITLALLAAALYLLYWLLPRTAGNDWFGGGTMVAVSFVWIALIMLVDPSSWRGAVMLLVAVAHLVVASLLERRMLAVPMALLSLGGLGYSLAAVTVVLEQNGSTLRQISLELVLQGLLLIGWGAAVVWGARALQFHRLGSVALVTAVAAGLLGLLVAVVGAGAWIGDQTGAMDDAVTAAHALATIGWMLVAAALLALGLRRGRWADLGIKVGLVVAGIAVAKLFLYDLSALDGIWRGLAFLVVGLLLLAAGTGYARALARAKASSSPPGNHEPTTQATDAHAL